jgi:hypothetical protein
MPCACTTSLAIRSEPEIRTTGSIRETHFPRRVYPEPLNRSRSRSRNERFPGHLRSLTSCTCRRIAFITCISTSSCGCVLESTCRGRLQIQFLIESRPAAYTAPEPGRLCSAARILYAFMMVAPPGGNYPGCMRLRANEINSRTCEHAQSPQRLSVRGSKPRAQPGSSQRVSFRRIPGEPSTAMKAEPAMFEHAKSR